MGCLAERLREARARDRASKLFEKAGRELEGSAIGQSGKYMNIFFLLFFVDLFSC